MFVLKKIVSVFTMPLPIVVLVLLVGLVGLWRGKKPERARWWVTAGIGLLLLFAFKPLGRAYLAPLEGQYADYRVADSTAAAQVEWVVVLGGGVAYNPDLPPNNLLSRGALARVVEGVLQAQDHPQARLLLSGGAVFSGIPEAVVMAQVAEALGVPPTRLVADTLSRDTGEQAQRLAAQVGDGASVVLVTSAFHMPRSMALFKAQGLTPIPAPTDRFLKGDPHLHPADFAPRASHIAAIATAQHEYVGMLWSWLRGDL